MPGTMFGAPEGIRAYDEDLRADYRTAADVTRELGQIAMQPGQKRLVEAHAGKAEMELEAEKRFAVLMSQQATQSGGKPISMAEQLNSLAQRAAQAGLVTKAADLAGKAALIQSRETSALLAGAKLGEAQLDVIRKQAGLVGQLFGGVNDQASWQRANSLYEFQTGKQSPYAAIPFNAELVESINQQALSTKERADAAQKAAIAESLKTFRRARLDQHDTELDISERRLQLAEERERRLKKQGTGGGVAGPVNAELSQARRLIGKDFENMEAADMADAAYSVAAEARALRKRNPALDANAALQQAYAAAVQAGDFQTTQRSALGVDLPGTSKTVFAGRGKSATSPVSIPKGPAGTAIVKGLPVGKYVRTANGVLGITTKTGVVPILGTEEADAEEDNGEDDE